MSPLSSLGTRGHDGQNRDISLLSPVSLDYRRQLTVSTSKNYPRQLTVSTRVLPLLTVSRFEGTSFLRKIEVALVPRAYLLSPSGRMKTALALTVLICFTKLNEQKPLALFFARAGYAACSKSFCPFAWFAEKTETATVTVLVLVKGVLS
jgi:hypothetical protein